MFEGLLKNKFYTKCKSQIKLTKTRIEVIKKKRNAMQRYLKNDVADLLKNGLDINAYGRAEGLLVELNLSTCYDFLEQFCVQISNNLAAMSKQRECPEECREAVSSLVFAAARIADLPELRELRTIFAERYGNFLDRFANQVFVEKLKSAPPTKDMKLKLMQDIATELGLDWNSKTMEQKLYNSTAYKRDLAKNSIDDEFKTPEKADNSVPMPFHLSHNPVDRTPFKDIQVDKTGREGQAKEQYASRNVPEEEFDEMKSFPYKLISPPYNKSKIGKTRNQDERVEPAGNKQHLDVSVSESKRKPTSVRRRRTKPASGGDDVRIEQKDNHNQQHEEERMMDRLLIHYSQKKSLYETGKSESVLKPPPQQATIDSGRATGCGRCDGPPTRATSLPVEPEKFSETKNGHARASSLQPDMLNPKGHVHPKLPDYDDFVARLAALRGGN